MTETKKKQPGIAQLTITLLAITAVIALLLAFVNDVTKDEIARRTADKTAAAMLEVLPGAEQFIPHGDSYVVDPITGVSIGEDAQGICGYVVEVSPSGFGGAFSMVVGVDVDGVVTGISIIKHAETSGLGAEATKADWREQFKGGAGSVALSKNGGNVDALTGATVTSQAVVDGVNAALDYIEQAQEFFDLYEIGG